VTTPSERLRAVHVPYRKTFGPDQFCRACRPLTPWPCDIVVVLDAADALAGRFVSNSVPLSVVVHFA